MLGVFGVTKLRWIFWRQLPTHLLKSFTFPSMESLSKKKKKTQELLHQRGKNFLMRRKKVDQTCDDGQNAASTKIVKDCEKVSKIDAIVPQFVILKGFTWVTVLFFSNWSVRLWSRYNFTAAGFYGKTNTNKIAIGNLTRPLHFGHKSLQSIEGFGACAARGKRYVEITFTFKRSTKLQGISSCIFCLFVCRYAGRHF